jgi:hypothetical protein
MTRDQINAIRRQIEAAATDPARADAVTMLNLVRDEILPVISKPYPAAEGILAPTTTERAVLGDVAQILLGDECQSKYASWRMSGAQTALRAIDRITVFGVAEDGEVSP